MKVRIIVVWLLCLMSTSLSAQKVFVIDEKLVEEKKDTIDDFIKGEYLEILEDTSNKLTIQEVSSGSYNDKYYSRIDGNQIAVIKNRNATYWLRFRIKSKDLPQEYYVLENMDLHIGFFELYKPSKKDPGTYISERAGFSIPFEERVYPHKNFVFNIPVDTTVQTYYIKIKSPNQNPFLIRLKSTYRFSYYAFNEYYWLGMFYGIIFIMAVYNLLLYLSLRESVYIYYVIYAICCGLITFGEDGTGFQYLWPGKPYLNNYISLAAPLLLMLSFAMYSKSFLEIKRVFPLANKILNIIMGVYILFFLLDVLVLKMRIDFPLYIFPFLFIYISSFVCWRKGLRQARYFIIGYSFMFTSIVFLIFRMGGWIHWSDIFTVYSFNIGMVFEIVILSFALGDRIRIIKAQNEEAQQRIIEQLQENEKLKDKVNRELEEKVRERTSELNEKNNELKDAYNEINRMNELLDADNKVLKTNVKELTKARVLMKEVDFAEFSKIFPDKESCFKYLEDLKWVKGYSCKKCGNEKWCKGKDEYSRRCTKCRYDESPTAYTIFHKLKFPINKAFYMLFLVYANKEKITSLELSQILSLRQSTCWNFNKKINEALKNKKKSGDHELDGWSQLVLDPDSSSD